MTLSTLDIDADVDGDTNESSDAIVDCVLTTRLLAKFLGYINFLPYLGKEKRTPVMDELYLELRSMSAIPLDVSTIFHNARKTGDMCKVVPWVVQYLSQIDGCSLCIPYYDTLAKELMLYYQEVQRHMSGCSHSHLLQYVCLSWLFSLTQFETVAPTPVKPVGSQPNLDIEKSIDQLALIPVSLVYVCSLSLQSVRRTLVEYTAGIRAQSTVTRKITPLTTQVSIQAVEDKVEKSYNDLQKVLEENFYSNQPASLSKTVTFISERIASSYIKEFRLSHLNPALVKGQQFVYQSAKAVCDKSHIGAVVTSQVEQYCHQTYESLYTQCSSGINSFFTERVNAALTSLLSSDISEAVIAICSNSIIKQGRDRVIKWLQANLTYHYLSTELKHELFKYIRNSGNVNTPNVDPPLLFVKQHLPHNLSAPSPSQTLFDLQAITGSALTGVIPDANTLMNVIENVTYCLRERHDITQMLARTLLSLLVSLLVCVIMNSSFSLDITAEPLRSLWNDHQLSENTEHLLRLIPDSPDDADDKDQYNWTVKDKLCNFYLQTRGLISHS